MGAKKTKRPTGAPRRRQCSRVRSERVSYHRVRGTVGLDHGRNRVGALGGGRAPGCERTRIRFVVAGQVERNDPISRLHQRFGEHCQVRALAAPAVHQIYRRALAPFLTGDPMPIPIRFYRSARGYTRRHAQTRLENRWGAP